MTIVDLTLAHADETDILAINVMEKRGFKTGVTRHYWAPMKEPDVLFVDSWLSMFAHCGTHLDCPRHIFRWGKTVDQVELDCFMGPGCVLDFSKKKANEPIAGKELEKHRKVVKKGDIVLIRTDWSDKTWGSAAYMFQSPFLTGDGARWCVDKGVKAVGFDFLQEEEVKKSPNNVPEKYVVHRTLLENGVVQIEHMANLKSISKPRCQVIALPLKLIGVEGSPCRAVAIVD